jgi:uncharacterized membrane protein YqiK
MENEHVAALKILTPEQEEAYVRVVEGLLKLESALPSECTAETQEEIGRIINTAKKVEKFSADIFREIAQPWQDKINLMRLLWKPLGERAIALQKKATALVERLLMAERQRREEAEREARRIVAEKTAQQAAAEAKALAAESDAEAAAAKQAADQAWAETRQAVQALDKAPATTSVKVGDATVYESNRLDFEITDMAAFAKAHPELVEVRRGPTLMALRAALTGTLTLPPALPGFPGVKLKSKTTTSSR